MSRRRKKNQERRKADDLLAAWQLERLEKDRDLPLPARGPSEVTLLVPFAPPRDRVDERFPRLECAIRETWRHCGLLRTVIVVDRPIEPVRAFAGSIPNGIVLVQVEPALSPGRPETVSADLNANLAKRVSTNLVLTIREDAFPVRPGLGSFVDGIDFVGAPKARGGFWSRLASRLWNARAMDGAFSLRSLRLARLVADEWSARHAGKPWRAAFEDGLYATRTLPRASFAYRRAVRFPAPVEAETFCYDASGPAPGRVPPFGFRGAAAFKVLLDKGLV